MAYNASQTKSPVSYKLDNEDYTFVCNRYKLYFSTLAHKEKFAVNIRKRIEWLNDSMTRRFHVPIMADELAIIQFYMMCEGRGFRVRDVDLGVEYTSPLMMGFYMRQALSYEFEETGSNGA